MSAFLCVGALPRKSGAASVYNRSKELALGRRKGNISYIRDQFAPTFDARPREVRMAPAVKHAEKPDTTIKARSAESAGTAAPSIIRPASAISFCPKRSPAHCRSAATRHSGRRSGSMPSRFQVRRSPPRALKIAALGPTASSRRWCIGLMRASRTG